ncbi:MULTISPECIES: MmcQ/YjbR family DNA-binding protein [unclassified Pseudomonas]|uniref:MmcQ/YjbR family DNA-binding protein n=1 Tax=unclassified Pseudomonas TaxID=196821 RepID=UPI000BD0DF51|nr:MULTISPECIES: MmcQ/YjbR family DNA-binding protein [unclassified Pseudomonas]PVZ19486.1 putative DNA-binding protein (MmcQ/YjbR family) [Pseudomonas sp. URIL14HWK12:I12]PVZ22929.1 putative DNA-binding protein (MmcQ/YjbR family) [Pseudomonas sp. URIL14HWK12:I10]PVZ37441.1 putative DNA-binding protein (MmcQ/YjbR family) [Pseudomonas sp. URIL14HWK12:I11]SNZ14793.1 Predicted DNA-binding protein, MmcQ/YjbR family [Pseudomonas sp. URIL14HWK12:I9]
MNAQQIAAHCLSLPGAREDYKWGGVRVFSVAGNKMFAACGLKTGGDLAFKVDAELFLGYCDRPGFRPAPYLARAMWVSMEDPSLINEQALRAMLERSHQLVVARLPRRTQAGLLLDHANASGL